LAEIKSALELALEKAEKYGRASREELAQSQYQDQGRQLAVQFLKGEGDLAAEETSGCGSARRPAGRQRGVSPEHRAAPQ
jgi:hypothetical protein